jgi:hypothetical protein
MAQERIIELSIADSLADDDYSPVDGSTGTRRALPDRLLAKGALALGPFDPGAYLGVSILAVFNGEAGVVPMSDATGGFLGVLQAQLQQSVAGLSADAQQYANDAQAQADLANARANALPGVVLDDGGQSARSWQDQAQRTALVSPVLAVRRKADADLTTNSAGEKVYTFVPADLFCLMLFSFTQAAFLDCPPQLFAGNAADGTEGAAWVHCVRLGTPALTIRAQPGGGGGGGGGGTTTPVTLIGHKSYSGRSPSTLPTAEPVQSLLLSSVPAGNDRRVVVAGACAYNTAGTHVVACTATFGPTTGTKVAVAMTKIVAETSTGHFTGTDPDPLCLAVFEGTLPDSANVQDLAVSLDFGGASHTDLEWCWAAEVFVAKDVGSRPSAGTTGSSDGGAAAASAVPVTWNQPTDGLALFGAFGQGGAAAPVTRTGAGAVDDTGKTPSNTTLKDIGFLFGHAATTGSAQTATITFSLSTDWAKFVVNYQPKSPAAVVGPSAVTVLQPAGLLGAQYKHAYVYPLTDGLTYLAAGT